MDDGNKNIEPLLVTSQATSKSSRSSTGKSSSSHAGSTPLKDVIDKDRDSGIFTVNKQTAKKQKQNVPDKVAESCGEIFLTSGLGIGPSRESRTRSIWCDGVKNSHSAFCRQPLTHINTNHVRRKLGLVMSCMKLIGK